MNDIKFNFTKFERTRRHFNSKGAKMGSRSMSFSGAAMEAMAIKLNAPSRAYVHLDVPHKAIAIEINKFGDYSMRQGMLSSLLFLREGMPPGNYEYQGRQGDLHIFVHEHEKAKTADKE